MTQAYLQYIRSIVSFLNAPSIRNFGAHQYHIIEYSLKFGDHNAELVAAEIMSPFTVLQTIVTNSKLLF